MKKLLCALALILPTAVFAADKVKVGFVTTLSGPGSAIGIDVRDGFNLLVKMNGGKLGGLPAQVIVADDATKPEQGKQAVERMLNLEKVDVMTGIVFSNVLFAALPSIFDAKIPYLSPNTGPEDFAGAKCHPNFYAIAWQNEDLSAVMGKWMTDKGFKNVMMIAPNYQGGRETLNGVKRGYKGPAQEIYTKLGQIDYGAELTSIRAAKPDALYMFLPGGMGINFVKQFVAAGMSRDIQLVMTGVTADEDVLKPLGNLMLGTFNTSHWGHDLDNEANRKFVAAFEKEYGRLPSMFAAQSYDTALAIDSGIRGAKGRIENAAAFRRGLEAANFKSVRGPFKFNKNHYPIHDIYLRVVVQDAKGRITNKTVGTVARQFADPFAEKCNMPKL
jgi:branched-chain amino acid transport system substrate-binding protein